MDFLYSILSFVLAIGVLVTVHEFGHYWVARRLGVKVLRFSIGFGRPLWLKRAGQDNTEYVIAAVPLGGYVKMLDEREGEVSEEELPRAFNRKPLWVRFAVVFAGPLFNFLFAIIAYWAVFVMGINGLKPLVGEVATDSVAARAGLEPGQEITAVDERDTRTWEAVIQAVLGKALDTNAMILAVVDGEGRSQRLTLDLRDVSLDDLTQGKFFQTLGAQPVRPSVPPVIGRVEPDGAGARSGLMVGDLIVSADGEAIPDWVTWVAYVRGHPEQQIRTEISRNDNRLFLVLRPDAVDDGENGAIGRIGAAVQAPTDGLNEFYVREQYPPFSALGQAAAKTYDMTLLTLRMLWKMLLLEVSVENLSGPISIAQYAGYSAQIGITRYLEFLAIVSISLGILNLLPIPVLDGGHLLYYFVELFKGRPVSEETQALGQRLGIAMLFGLMGLAFYNDLARLFG